MDGFHLDNLVLDRLGLRARKGSPPTFDAFGYINTLSRIHEDRELVWVPLFDRSMDLARAGAIEVSRHNRLVITEGNYLLLAEDPWQQVGELVDKTVLVDVGLQTLAERLMQRWLDHGFNDEEARSKVEDNDLDNARYILNKSMTPDWRLVNE
jgi:pantothenate kinase